MLTFSFVTHTVVDSHRYLRDRTAAGLPLG